MSLINDALRRAQQSQPPSSPAASTAGGVPPLRPVEPRRSSSGSARWVLVLVALLFFGGAVWALWLGSRQRGEVLPPPVTTEIQTVSHQPPPVALPDVPVVKTPPIVAPVVQTNTVIVLVTNVVAAVSPATNSAPATPPPSAPVFPALKLQGIFYLPSNPSVMINGRTLYVNEEVEKAKVLAITKTSVTVVWAGQTNVMSMR